MSQAGPTHTPYLNKIAKSGTLFMDFHVANPVCSPSRAGIMTGRDPARFRIHTAINVNPAANAKEGQANFLAPNVTTITQVMKDNGYATGHFGKWHLGAAKGIAPPPSAYGIDESCTFNSVDTCLADGKTSNTSVNIVDSAIDFITRKAGAPFYVNVWLHVSHNLLNPSAEQKAACVANSQACACAGLSDNQTTCAHQIFWAAQQDADAQIGRIWETLKEQNLHESTVVAFTTDNGPEDETVYISAVGSAGPFRGRKRSLYEGGIRVPFIVNWGGGSPNPSVAANMIDNTILGAVDWFPTALAIANITMPASLLGNLDGVDMSAAIARLGGAAVVVNNETGIRPPFPRPNAGHTAGMLFWEWRFATAGNCEHAAPQLAVRDGRYKLLRDIAEPADGGRTELYDLSFFNQSVDNVDLPDYREQKNLAALPGNPFKDRIAAMSAAVLKWRSSLPQCNDGTIACYMLTTPCSDWSYPGSLWRQSSIATMQSSASSGVAQGRGRAAAVDDDVWQDSEPDF